MKLSAFILLVFFVSCFSKSEKQIVSENRKQSQLQKQGNENTAMDTCRSYKELESHQNQDAFIEGKLIEYVPPHDNSKLGDEKIWDWEIVLPDKNTYPLVFKDPTLDISSFTGKNVIVKGKVFYGIIFGEENTANMRGYRIDAMEINLK
jgi:hypothetical protein